MARITVEDCIDKFPSRFELVLVASNRARKLHSGETATVEKDNDKNTVIALREIAQETLTQDQLKNDLIEEYQTATFTEDEDLEENDSNIDSEINSDDSTNLSSQENLIEENFSQANDDEQSVKDNSQEEIELNSTDEDLEKNNSENEKEMNISETKNQEEIEEIKTD